MNKTAAIVIIGSEIINGEITDVNGMLISTELAKIGFRVSSISIINDDLNNASDLIRFLSPRETVIITVGGLGPTIDDITMAAIAKAFEMNLVSKPALSSTDFRKMSGSETSNNLIKNLPEGSRVINSPHGPVVRTNNVYSLPGLPGLVKNRLKVLMDLLFEPFGKQYKREWVIELPQSSIAALLEEGTRLFPNVTVGCYPQKDSNSRTKIILSGTREKEVGEFYDHIMKAF
jgi:molybdenum cofactor synthesis domain-containing protein